MNWSSVTIMVSWTTMDPGVTNCDGDSVTIARKDIKEGQFLRYNDPSGTLPSLKVLEVKKNSLKLEVGSRVMEIEPGGTVPLCRTGYNYTNFDLDICLNSDSGFSASTDVDEEDEVLETARDRYKVFSLSPEQIEALKRAKDQNRTYLLGQWYWYVRSEEGWLRKAEELFRQAAQEGCADAWMGLARMYRSGALGTEDLDHYIALRDKALQSGSMVADLACCLDLADGIGGEADLDAAERYANAHISDLNNTPPEWYDALGWVLLKKGQAIEAGNKFATAGLKYYVSAYDGLLATTQSWDVVQRAYKAGCARAYTLMAENYRRQYHKATASYWKDSFAQDMLRSYELALRYGDPAAARPLALLYKEGGYGVEKDEAKALEYARRGSVLGDASCVELINELT